MPAIIAFENLKTWCQSHPAQRLVLTNGCFDILHVGHLRYLQAARRQGDLLLVGVNSDASVQALKGPTRPVNRAQDRAELLAGLHCVDAVTIFSDTTADALIAQVRPTIYVKAGDYNLETLPESPTLQKYGIQVLFLPFETGYSTTNTLNKVHQQTHDKGI